MKKPKRNYRTKPVRISDVAHDVAADCAAKDHNRSIRSFVEMAIHNEAARQSEASA